jgi:glycosyltransferase involved in cell wall biosynthesis
MNSGPSLSVVIPTIDETDSLTQTVQSLLSPHTLGIREVLLIVAKHTTPETLAVCRGLLNEHRGRVRILEQHLPYLGGAFRAGIAAASGSHIVLMFADLESDPCLVPQMASLAATQPEAIISASRWLRKGSFAGYGHVKLILNYFFQWVCALACNSGLTDFTYGFRLYPSAVLQEAIWNETGHAFVLESILKPLLWNVPVCELPAQWIARKEGTKHSRFFAYSRYLITLIRFLSRHGQLEWHPAGRGRPVAGTLLNHPVTAPILK